MLSGVFLYSGIYAQKDTVNMNPVEVNGLRMPRINSENSRIVLVIGNEEIRNAPVQDLNALLAYVVSADLRQRGQEGVQADVSMRGGSFEQTLILLNGIKMNDPQTGHHSMDIPVSIDDIERIEVLEGSGLRNYGINAYSGAINIITKKDKGKSIGLSAMAGQNKLYSFTARTTFDLCGIQNSLSVERKASDGYIFNTDFDVINLYYNGFKTIKTHTIEVQAGYNNKKFGANSFYSAKYPDQFEQTRTFFVNAGVSGGKKLKYSFQAFYRRHQDCFELFRKDAPSWYKGHNYHLTHVCGANAGLNFLSLLGKTNLGVEFRNEKIYSNVLGDPMGKTIDAPGETAGYYDKSKNRMSLSVFGGQAYFYKKFSVSGGFMINKTSGYNWSIYGGGDASFEFTPSIRLIASVNQSVRLPTFTDLYYQGPQNKGNPYLMPEKAITYEAGLKFNRKVFSAHVCYFLRNSKNVIDWVKMPDSVKWETRNITRLATHGIEASTTLNFNALTHSRCPVEFINASYAHLILQKNSEDYISYYVLDYLRNKLVFTVCNRIYKNLKMNWVVSWYDRAGAYSNFKTGRVESFKPYYLIDCRVFYDQKPFYFYVECSNLTAVQYVEISNIEQPGRWIKAGINFNLSFKPTKS